MKLLGVHSITRFAALALAATLVACGGGGGGSSSVPGGPGPQPSPTSTVAIQAVSGHVDAIPVDGYGSTATPTGPLVGAKVVVGSALIQSGTLPASLPAGDVLATTDASGNFTITPVTPPAAPAGGTYYLPIANVFSVAAPTSGYFVMIYAVGTDGKSAGAPLPVHAFAQSTGGNLGKFRVTTASVDEANFLAQVNVDRGAHGVSNTITFDEAAEEAARLHANQMMDPTVFGCHYDSMNQGPTTRFIQIGGLGLDEENITGTGDLIGNYVPPPPTELTKAQLWAGAEQAYVAEGPSGGHYLNLMNAANVWTGLAIVTNTTTTANSYAWYGVTDMENVDFSTLFLAPTYPTVGCQANITDNKS